MVWPSDKFLRDWDSDGARGGMGEIVLKDFVFRRLLVGGGEEARSMWGGGWGDKIFLKL